MIQVIAWFILLFLLNLSQPGFALAAPEVGDTLEALQYRVSLGIWSEVAVVQLRLARLGPNRYRAEFSGAAQGVWRLLRRWLPEGYETEMLLEDGWLKPIIYREEFQSKGHHIHKEYHFDYSRKVLEVWRGVDYQPPVKRLQVPMQEPVYDPLSLFYNLRMGTFGVLQSGQNLRVVLIPASESREMVLHFGSETYAGRKVILEVKGRKGEDEGGPYFLFCTPEWAPQEAWIRVPFFGKLTGHLLNPEGIMPGGGLKLPSAPTQKGP